MYVKEGLVFEKSSGAVIEFSDLGDLNNILQDVERQFKNPNDHQRPLAKVMLVFMVRGLFTSMKYVTIICLHTVPCCKHEGCRSVSYFLTSSFPFNSLGYLCCCYYM